MAALGAEPAPPASPRPAPSAVPGTASPGAPELQSDGRYRLADAGLELWVDPEQAGRVVRLSFDGEQLLAAAETSPRAFGSELSLGLQPDPAQSGRYEGRVEHDTLVLSSPSAAQPAVRIVKRYRLDRSRRAVELGATVSNETSAPVGLTPRERCHLPPVGLSFYPSRGPYPQSTLQLDQKGDTSWLVHERAQAPQALDSFADGAEGWLAYGTRDVLLVRTFPDLPEADRSRGRGEIELAAEREPGALQTRAFSASQQGAARELAPGQTQTLATRWYLRRLPARLALAPGNLELLGFVRGVIQ